MSAWSRLKEIFVSSDPDEDSTDALPDLEYDEPFVFSQHLRVVLAIVITMLSALIIWWILA